MAYLLSATIALDADSQCLRTGCKRPLARVSSSERRILGSSASSLAENLSLIFLFSPQTTVAVGHRVHFTSSAVSCPWAEGPLGGAAWGGIECCCTIGCAYVPLGVPR
jgi:hypothetical protein